MTQDFKCVLDAAIFARAACCVSKEETGYYLSGVQVEPCHEGGALLIATDGSCMIVLRDEHAFVEGHGIVNLSPDMLKACTAKSRVRDGNMLAVSGKSACVVGFLAGADRSPCLNLVANPNQDVTCTQHIDVLVDGTFPEWRRVVPDKLFPDKPWGSFDPTVLAKVTKALCAVKGENVIVVPSGGLQDAAIVFGSHAGSSAFGIVMPTRAAFNLFLPSWVRAKPAPQKRPAKASKKIAQPAV